MATKVPWGERHPNSSCDNCPARGAFCDSLGGNSCANILIAWAAKDDDGKPEIETAAAEAMAGEPQDTQAQEREKKYHAAGLSRYTDMCGVKAQLDYDLDELKARLEKVGMVEVLEPAVNLDALKAKIAGAFAVEFIAHGEGDMFWRELDRIFKDAQEAQGE
jgi:hypothetical protein